jgi:hypothetical protein
LDVSSFPDVSEIQATIVFGIELIRISIYTYIGFSSINPEGEKVREVSV